MGCWKWGIFWTDAIELNLIQFSLIKTLHIAYFDNTLIKYPIEMIANKKSAEMDFNLKQQSAETKQK